jgi:hypothetical protein
VNETYVECLVKRKSSIMMKLFKYLSIMLAVCFLFLWVMGLRVVIMAIAIVFAALAYLLNLYGEIEYEYLYVDKELVIDRIMNRSRRKRIGTFDIGRMEILAPLKSHALDSYRSRAVKALDYSSRKEQQPEVRYAMFYDGKSQLILEPSPELLKAIRSVAPRKVFSD